MELFLQFNFMIYSTIVFFLLICLLMRNSVPKEHRRRTLDLLVFAAIAESVLESFWFLASSRFLGILISTGSSILIQIVFILEFKFFLGELGIFSHNKHWKKIYYLLNLPITFLVVIEPITGWLFNVDEHGTITATGLRDIWAGFMFLVTIFLLVCAAVQMDKAKKRDDKNYYHSTRTILETLIIILVSATLQYLLFPDAFSITLSIALGVVYLYIRIYSELLANSKAMAAAIETELEAARNVQLSLVPSKSQKIQARSDFEIDARLFPSKAVGGDFYDYYMPDEEHLVITMADVSGKGMPAALFMAMSKTQIKNCYDADLSAAEILAKANDIISLDNNEKMFVTVWLGILDLTTGIMDCANAGHEYPALRRKGGSYELFNDPHGFVLGAISGMKYKSYSIEFEPGDILFTYTDGIPEAENKGSFMGRERMLDEMNRLGDIEAMQFIMGLREAIYDYAEGEMQSDDITMLYLKYKGV